MQSKSTLMMLILISLSSTQTKAEAVNVKRLDDGLWISEPYFKRLKKDEMKYQYLEDQYKRLERGCEAKAKDCDFDITPRSFGLILASGFVLGYLGAKAAGK